MTSSGQPTECPVGVDGDPSIPPPQTHPLRDPINAVGVNLGRARQRGGSRFYRNLMIQQGQAEPIQHFQVSLGVAVLKQEVVDHAFLVQAQEPTAEHLLYNFLNARGGERNRVKRGVIHGYF